MTLLFFKIVKNMLQKNPFWSQKFEKYLGTLLIWLPVFICHTAFKTRKMQAQTT